jgi:hypothetical protein
MIIVGMLWVGNGNSEQLTWKNDTLRSDASNIKIQDSFSRLEEINDNCRKALHTVMMDSGFTVSVNGAGYESCFYPIAYVHLINNVCVLML